MRIRRFSRHALVVARREFMTAVTQPSFAIFLLSPLIILLISMVSGGAMDAARSHSLSKRSVVVLASGDQARIARQVDARLRSGSEVEERAPLRVEAPSDSPEDQAKALLSEPGSNVTAVLYGPLRTPQILRSPDAGADARYLAQIAEETLQAIRIEELAARGSPTPERADIRVSRPTAATAAMTEAMGALAIVVVFISTYLLSSHIASGFAEERSSKVIEILASSASLESVFFGKLLGELAVAMLFTGFWLVTLVVGAIVVGLPEGGQDVSGMIAATGGLFPVLLVVYFVLSYLISSCTILGLASLSSTPRGAAIMVMPFSLMQFGMMSLATYVAMKPGTPVFWLAVAIPYSSPLVMVSRAAMSPSLALHVAAISWQLLWVVVIVRTAARAFRRGALGDGRGIDLGAGDRPTTGMENRSTRTKERSVQT